MSIDPTATFAARMAHIDARLAEVERIIGTRASGAGAPYTPTLTGHAVGTVAAVNEADWSLSGTQLLVTGEIVYGTSGATLPNSSATLLGLPAGFDAATVDATRYPFGLCSITVSGDPYFGVIQAHSATQVRVMAVVSGRITALGAAVPATWEAGSGFRYQFSLPIRRAL